MTLTTSKRHVAMHREDDIIAIDVPPSEADAVAYELRRQGIHTLPRYDGPDRVALLVVSTLGLDEVEAALEGWEVERVTGTTGT